MSVTRSSPAHALAGFVLMGGWAAFANRAHPMPAPLIAFLVQGALTAGITLILKRVIEHVLARFPATPWLAPLAAAALSATLLTTIHSLAGTPALWATVAVPFTVASGYAVLYTRVLVRGRHG